jgi:hypothetical protein
MREVRVLFDVVGTLVVGCWLGSEVDARRDLEAR